MKISTKRGDNGESGLFNGRRLAKSNLYFEVLGDLDELQSVLGWCKFGVSEGQAGELADEFWPILEQIQRAIYVMMGIIGNEMRVGKQGDNFGEKNVALLEELVEKYEAVTEDLREFVLPGSSEGSARFHIARTVCRRAERSLVKLNEKVGLASDDDGAGGRKIPGDFFKYLNRLSDLLFLMGLVK